MSNQITTKMVFEFYLVDGTTMSNCYDIVSFDKAQLTHRVHREIDIFEQHGVQFSKANDAGNMEYIGIPAHAIIKIVAREAQ